MYTIKGAAARTGLSVPVIRVWERRYGVVAPERTPAGYRLYDEASIARLIAMRHLVVNEGWQPSQAARRVLEPGFELPPSPSQATGDPVAAPPGQRAVDGLGSTPSAVASAAVPGTVDRSASLVESFVSAARALDVPAMERALDESLAAQRFELAIEDVVAPALRAIGSAWARNEIDVGAEHAASETVRRRLARFFDAASRGDRAPRLVVGLVPGGHHEIGAFAFAVAARRAGLDVLYLGANVPIESWVRTVRETRAPLVVLGVVTEPDALAARGVLEALRAAQRPPICLVGGPLADAPFDAPGAIRLPAALDDAVAMVVELLGAQSG
jgi:methanogenic corrinoid protein MtbC1